MRKTVLGEYDMRSKVKKTFDSVASRSLSLLEAILPVLCKQTPFPCADHNHSLKQKARAGSEVETRLTWRLYMSACNSFITSSWNTSELRCSPVRATCLGSLVGRSASQSEMDTYHQESLHEGT